MVLKIKLNKNNVNDISNIIENKINNFENNPNIFLLDSNKNNEISLTTETINNYKFILEKHNKNIIPYCDHELYKDMLDLSKSIVHNEELESWYILDLYIELNIEHLNLDFLVEAIEGFSKIKYFKFKFWYFCENKIIENIKHFSNDQISKLIYYYSYPNKGSDYFYKILSEEIFRRKISNFTEGEFILIYNGFKMINFKDKIFNLILEKARKEIFNNL